MDLMGWIFTAIALTGTILNIRQRREGFALWVVSNSYWAWCNFDLSLYPQAFLFTVYLGLAIWGYLSWKR